MGFLDKSAEDDGRVFVPIANSGWSHVLRQAKNEETRKRMLFALEKGPDGSAEIAREIFLRRDSQARLLGYHSHAEVKMLTSAVKSTKWVQDFLEDVRQNIVAKSDEAKARMLDALVQDRQEQDRQTLADDELFEPWNGYYCSRLVQEEEKADQSRISEFFPVENTTRFMLDAFASFLDLEFIRMSSQEIPDDSLWHEEVQVWSVWDNKDSSSFVGYLYLDLMWRENKYPGFFNHEIECVGEPRDIQKDNRRKYSFNNHTRAMKKPTARDVIQAPFCRAPSRRQP